MNAPRNRRGAVAAMSAVVIVGVLGFAGLAIDLTRIWMVNARLKTAIDAASLVAARTISADAAQRDALVRNIYWANFTQNGRSNNYMLATALQPTITQLDVDRIQVTGTAIVPTTLFSIIDRRDTTITDSAIARRQVTGLELALVLDVTGSMASNNNIAALRTAAENLVDTVFANQVAARPTVWVSVVPYTSMVNIGRTRTNWLVPGSLNPDNFLPTVWRGCVEARAGTSGLHTYRPGADQDDSPPSIDPFRPHFYPSNRYQFSYERNPNTNTGAPVLAPNGSRYVWVYRAPGNTRVRVLEFGGVAPEDLRPTDIPVNRGDNAWIPGAGGTVDNSNTRPAWSVAVWEPDPENPGADEPAGGSDNERRGPNLGCGRAVLPLTSNKQAVVDQIRALRAIRRGGTMANTGLQLGWGTISPRWRADWNLNEFREGNQLPLDYNVTAMSKAIVLMTDGENQWFDWGGGAPGVCGRGVNQCHPANPAPPPGVPIYTDTVDGDQNAYGRMSENRLNIVPGPPTGGPGGTAAQNVPNGINARMASLCEAVKANNVTVYTILFVANPSTAVENLYRSCATRPENYFLARDQAQLSLAFATIAGQLASLRLLE